MASFFVLWYNPNLFDRDDEAKNFPICMSRITCDMCHFLVCHPDDTTCDKFKRQILNGCSCKQEEVLNKSQHNLFAYCFPLNNLSCENNLEPCGRSALHAYRSALTKQEQGHAKTYYESHYLLALLEGQGKF